MIHARLVFVIATLAVLPLRVASAHDEEEANPDINFLGAYLGEMSEKLDCYFTFEDRPDAEGGLPWIVYIEDVFTPDLEVATIDDLVANLNEEIPDVKFRRSTKYPSVVHVIAKDLLVEGYVMDERVSTEYSGLLGLLPDQLGTLLNGKIASANGGSIPVRIEPDVTTEVEVDVEDKTVRDVLTGAVPRVPERRFLWESQRHVDHVVEVRIYAALEDETMVE